MKSFLVLLTAGLAAARPTSEECGISLTGYPEIYLEGNYASKNAPPDTPMKCMDLGDTEPFNNKLRSVEVQACEKNPKKSVEAILFSEAGCPTSGTSLRLVNNQPLLDLEPGSSYKSVRFRQCDEPCQPLVPEEDNPAQPHPPSENEEGCNIDHKDGNDETTQLTGICKPTSQCNGNGVSIAGYPSETGSFPCGGGRDMQCCIQNWAIQPPKCAVGQERGVCFTTDNCRSLGGTPHKGEQDENGFWACPGSGDIQCCVKKDGKKEKGQRG